MMDINARAADTLHDRRASFETLATLAPQDEVGLQWH